MIELFDEAAAAVHQHYRAFLLQIVGIYAQMLDQPAPTAPASRAGFASNATLAQSLMLTAVTKVIDDSIDRVLAGIAESAGAALSAAQAENVSGIITEARNALVGQLMQSSQRDIEVATHALRQFSLQVESMMNAKKIPYVAAVINTRLMLDPGLRFLQLDRGGKNWDSSTFAKTAVRGFLVRTYVETYLYQLASRGIETAKVVYEDPTHKNAGLLFSVADAAGTLPTYESIKNEVWHPNSRALVSQG